MKDDWPIGLAAQHRHQITGNDSNHRSGREGARSRRGIRRLPSSTTDHCGGDRGPQNILQHQENMPNQTAAQSPQSEGTPQASHVGQPPLLYSCLMRGKVCLQHPASAQLPNRTTIRRVHRPSSRSQPGNYRPTSTQTHRLNTDRSKPKCRSLLRWQHHVLKPKTRPGEAPSQLPPLRGLDRPHHPAPLSTTHLQLAPHLNSQQLRRIPPPVKMAPQMSRLQPTFLLHQTYAALLSRLCLPCRHKRCKHPLLPRAYL